MSNQRLHDHDRRKHQYLLGIKFCNRRECILNVSLEWPRECYSHVAASKYLPACLIKLLKLLVCWAFSCRPMWFYTSEGHNCLCKFRFRCLPSGSPVCLPYTVSHFQIVEVMTFFNLRLRPLTLKFSRKNTFQTWGMRCYSLNCSFELCIEPRL